MTKRAVKTKKVMVINRPPVTSMSNYCNAISKNKVNLNKIIGRTKE
jgi:hypothetical protein